MSNAYYYLDGNEVRGPFALSDCFHLLDQGTIFPSTQVCLEGTEEWRRLDDYPELRGHRRRDAATVHGAPGVLTICAGILMAVLVLGLGGILMIQFHDRQVRAKAEAAANAARATFLAEEARAAKERETRMAAQAQAENARQIALAAQAQRDERVKLATIAARPTPTPRKRRIAPTGTYFLTAYVSVRTAHGMTGFEPGHTVRLITQDAKTGKFRVAEGSTEFEVFPMQVTNDLDVAELVRHQDEASQLAAQQLQQQDIAAAAAARLKIDLIHASVVNSLPGGAVVGGHSSLDKAPEPVGGIGYYGGSGDDAYSVPDTSLRSIGGGQ